MQPGKLLLCSSFLLCLSMQSSSQGLIKKLKQKVENATDKMVDKKINEKIGGGNTGPGQPGANETSRAGGSSGGRNSNSTGEGLVTVPPDVNKFLTEADEAFKK